MIYRGLPEIFIVSRIPLENDSGEVTRLLFELKARNRAVEERLIPLVYKELRRIASARLRQQRAFGAGRKIRRAKVPLLSNRPEKGPTQTEIEYSERNSLVEDLCGNRA